MNVIKAAITLWQLWSVIRKRLPSELRRQAMEAVRSAAILTHLPDHHARREWAVSQLTRLGGWKEHQARLAVEAAVAAWKAKEK